VLTRVYGVIENRSLDQAATDPDAALADREISPRLGWQLAYDSRERSRRDLRRSGLFFGLDISGSHESLGSDLSGIGVFTQISFFHPLGAQEEGRFTYAHAYRTGLINVSGMPVPSPDRLRIGGEFSVRGYPTNSLGPLAPDGTPLGGEVEFILNEEVHARLAYGLSALAFVDAGNVWAERGSYGGGLSLSAGLGFRYTSPIGPLRLDVGFPIDRRPTDPRYRIHFGFGTVF
jgi:translocation and assembly module TamA